jgi:biopolymer transport protein ExbD
LGFKKRNKVNAQFNMSSLTDIIFLLLIFFMLTSSLIIPNALNLKLPGKSRTPVNVVTAKPATITVQFNGKYLINGNPVNLANLDNAVRKMINKGQKVSIIISPHRNVPNEYVVAVMDIAFRYGIEAIMTEPR